MERKVLKKIKAAISCVIIFALLLGIVPTPDVKASEPVEYTRTSDFNSDWLFMLEAKGNPEEKDYDDDSWRLLNLPHDWSIEQDFDYKISTGVGSLKGGTGWYRKSFVLPENYAGKRINIDFDGVYQDSYIWVNGEEVGNYPNGYIPFSFDITDYVVCDGKTENVIAVKVTNVTNENNEGYTSRWYSGSGIYRDVHLTVTEPVHVACYGTYIRTPHISWQYSTGSITVEMTTTVENESVVDEHVVVKNTIYNYYGEKAFQGALPAESEMIKVPAGKSVNVDQIIVASNPKLWSLKEANLYKMKTEIIMNDKVVDSYDTRFGFNWSEFDADKGFSLNGEYMKIEGVCLHHDQGALGAVANVAAMKRQIQIMKDMGINAIRTAHNAAAPEFMRLCDEMGVMVFEESFDSWWAGKNDSDYGAKFFMEICSYPGADAGITWAEYDLKQIVKKDRNCPSIIMWSIGNECNETNEKKAIDYVYDIVGWVKEVDSEHPVTMADNKYKVSWSNPSIMKQVHDELDLVGLNYGEMYYDSLHEEKPDWKIFGSETTSTTSSRGYYASPWISGNHVVDNVDGNYAEDAVNGRQLSEYDNRTARFGRNVTEALIFDRDRQFIAGQFVWTGFDYIGEPTPLDGTAKSSYFGIVDTAGFPKDRYYLYQSQWLSIEENPMVHIMPHWNWEDDALRKKVTYPEKTELANLEPGEIIEYSDDSIGKIPLRIYSNAPAVELFVDGVSQGKKEFAQKVTNYGKTYQQQSEESDRLYLEWALEWKYKIGTTIEAVAYDNKGNEIARDKVITAGEAARLSVSADRTSIVADGSDLSYITVDVQDIDGNFVPNATNEITFDIEGDAEIVGVDNGDPTSRERYKDTNGVWKRSAFSGKALVIVRSTDNIGEFTLTASSNGLQSASVTVKTTEEQGYTLPEETMDNGNNATGVQNTILVTDNNVSQNVVKKGDVFVVKNVKYTVINPDKKTVVVAGIKKKNIRKINIPAKITVDKKTYKVTGIGKGAFKNCKKLKSVVVGKNVTMIGKNSFYNCKVLRKITISSSKIKKAASGCFKGISKKAVIKVPKTCYEKYTKLFKGKGQSKKVRIKK